VGLSPSADPELNREALGSAMRKCRSDFGADISINLQSIRSDPVNKISPSHHSLGTITYPDSLQKPAHTLTFYT
jgi:hypothetical protein